MYINNQKNNIEDIRIIVFILDLDRSEDTVKAAKSVLASDHDEIDIMILVNGSSNQHLENIRKQLSKFPHISVYYSNKNLGFTGGNNFLLDKLISEDRNYDYVLFLNNDAILGKDTLTVLENYLHKNPDTGIVGPRVLKNNPKDIIENGGARVWNYFMQQRFTNFGKKSDDCINTEPVNVPYVPGTCMLIRLDLLKKLGGFDRQYFAYFEDWDICIRARKAGLRCTHIPEAVVRHIGSKTSQKDSLLYHYLITRNRCLIARSHIPNPAFIFIFIPYFFFSRICYKFAILLVKGNFQGIKGLLMAILWLILPGRYKTLFSPLPN